MNIIRKFKVYILKYMPVIILRLYYTYFLI